MPRVVSSVLVLSLLACIASGAEAQRKKAGKRTRPKPVTTEEPAPEPGEPAPDAATTTEGEVLEITPAEAEAGPAAAVEPRAEAETPAEAPPPEASAPDPALEELSALRKELAAVMDRLVQTRARVTMLGKSLFKTRVRIDLQNDAAPDPIAERIVVLLDGAPVFSGDGTALDAEGHRRLFEGFAAPGPHVLTLELEQRSRDDDAYRYTLRDSFHFTMPRERVTALTLVIDDDSDIAQDFADDDEGDYELETRLSVRALEPGDED